MVLAADCLYPDMSAWPSFFATMASFVYSSNRPFGLIALHKRNGQMTLDPFLTYWRLKAEHIPLVDLGLEKEDGIKPRDYLNHRLVNYTVQNHYL